MEYVAIVSLLAVLQYIVFGVAVARARGKFGVKAPAVTGHEVFERHFRVQQNTLELLVALLPALGLFALYVSPTWAALLGVVYLVGRTLYFVGYVKEPARREFGFLLSIVPIMALLIGALIGAVRASM
jgi:glutathione S-transferase